MAAAVPKRIASGIINALKGGVVPRTGLGYIAVGRTAEINALLHDVDITEEGGAFFRFIVGRYGSGKELHASDHAPAPYGQRVRHRRRRPLPGAPPDGHEGSGSRDLPGAPCAI